MDIACLLPKRNCGDYFPQAIESLLLQKLPFSSITISENHSDDGSQSIADTYSSSVVSVLVPGTPRSSFGASCQFLLENRPCADYYLIASADDVWSCRFLELCAKVLEDNTNLSAIFTDRILIDARSRIFGATGNFHIPRIMSSSFATNYFSKGCYYIISGCLFRADIIQEAVEYASITGNSFDWALMLRAASLGDVAYLPRPLFKYRVYPQSTSSQHLKSHYHNLLLFSKLYDISISLCDIPCESSASDALGNILPPKWQNSNFSWFNSPRLKLLCHRLGLFQIFR